MVVFHWSVVGCDEFLVVFTSGQVSVSEIYSWMCYFYIIKTDCWPPNQQTSEASYKKKLPMDYNNVNRWYNIGITPIRDYINHSNTYPRITDYQDTSTHERVKTSSYMNDE